MKRTQNSMLQLLPLAGVMLLWVLRPLLAQVSPAEIRAPQLKGLEKTHLSQLVALSREIMAIQFPFSFMPSRYVGLDPQDQQGADQRGLEFVLFHNRTVLKVSGNYNAAFNADLLTQNQRANRVLDDVVRPILTLLTKSFPDPADFDAFGFEVSYHVRRQSQRYGYEGKENFVIVFPKEAAAAYLRAQRKSQRQEILDAAEAFLDGKEMGITLGERNPLAVEDTSHPERSPSSTATEKEPPSLPGKKALSGDQASTEPSPTADRDLPAGLRSTRAEETLKAVQNSGQSPTTASAKSQSDVDTLQARFQPQLDGLGKEGVAKYHFVEYAPPSLVLFRDQINLQLTLRNPERFDKNSTSIYKRAARSFDLFLAPMLKDLLAKVPDASEISGMDITVLDQFASGASSSEALEYVCPLSSLKQFTDYAITNQDLINQSLVLVNGVRISLNLQQVE